jgi:hypothetical protein
MDHMMGRRLSVEAVSVKLQDLANASCRKVLSLILP